MRLLYVPCKDKKEASTIAKALLDKKLIACANIFPITSFYIWKGKRKDEKEFVLLAKTHKKHAKAIRSEVKKLHSYKTPAIISFSADVNPSYENWMKTQLKR